MERYDPKTDLEDHEKFVGMAKSDKAGKYAPDDDPPHPTEERHE